MCVYISMRAKCPKYSLFLFEIREDDDDDDDYDDDHVNDDDDD